MDRHRFDTEDHAEQLIDATRAQFSSLTRAVLACDQVATKRITDALGDFIADDNAAGELVRSVLQNSQAALMTITDLIWAEAAELARQDLAAAERCRTESRHEARAERRSWNLAFPQA